MNYKFHLQEKRVNVDKEDLERRYIMAHDGRNYKAKSKLEIDDLTKTYNNEIAVSWDKTDKRKKLVAQTNILDNKICFIVYNGGKHIGRFNDVKSALDVYNEL